MDKELINQINKHKQSVLSEIEDVLQNKKFDTLCETVLALQDAIHEKLSATTADIYESTPADISSRYWLMQFLEPLSRKELKSIVDGFLIQILDDEQAKKLVKFLLIRFPHYYKEELVEKADKEGGVGVKSLERQEPKEPEPDMIERQEEKTKKDCPPSI